jgi:Protein of unknown function (DUF2441)
MPTTYYFCCSYLLGTGSIVEPGNWGRIVKKYQGPSIGNPWVLVRELIFEQVRFSSFSQKPSRFDSIFLCPDQQHIEQFRNSMNRLFDLCYEVEIQDRNPIVHLGDWTLPSLSNNEDYAAFVQKATTYWQGNPAQNVEVVTPHPVRIIRRI